MNCVKCGKKITNRGNFCKVCGTNNKVTQEIIDDAIKGGKESVEFLYRLTYKDMYKTVKFAGCPTENIQEVMIDSYTLGCSNLSGLSHPDRFSSWIDKIAIYRTINQLKDTVNGSFPATDGEDDEVEFIPEMLKELPNKLVGEKKAKEYIDNILGALTVEQRMTIVIFYYNKLSIKEISHGTGCSENTVKDRLNSGKIIVENQVEKLKKDGTDTYGLAPISYLLLLFESFNNIKGEFDEKTVLNSIKENIVATEEETVPVVTDNKENVEDKAEEVSDNKDTSEEENTAETNTVETDAEENTTENVQEDIKEEVKEEVKESTLTLDVPLSSYENSSDDEENYDNQDDTQVFDDVNNYDVPSHAMDMDYEDYEKQGKSLGFKIGMGFVAFVVVIALTVAGFLVYDYNFSDDPIIKKETTTQPTTVTSTEPTTVSNVDMSKLTSEETIKLISILLPTDSHHTPNFVSVSASDLIDYCIDSVSNSANDQNAKSLVGDYKKDSNGFYIKKDDVVKAVENVFGKDVSSSKYNGAYEEKDDKFYTQTPSSGDSYNHSYKIEKIVTDDGYALNVYYTYYDKASKSTKYNHAGVVRNLDNTEYPFMIYGSEELSKSEYNEAIGK